MKLITSTSNPHVRQLMLLQKKAKERNAQDVFVAEGPKMFRETPPERLVQVYASETFYQKNQTLFGQDRPLTLLSDRVFESVSDTRTPQGVLCVVRQYHYELRELLGTAHRAEDTLRSPSKEIPAGHSVSGVLSRGRSAAESAGIPERSNSAAFVAAGAAEAWPSLIMALENLQDPGNLGTILRTAEGAGVTGILLGPGCADLYNPKVIRSTMGSIYRMPFYYTEDMRRDICALRGKGVRWYAAHLEGSVPYDEPVYREPCGFLIGNESRGLTEATAALADARIRIPMCGQVESLNASVAASILMYEANRQRRAAQASQ
ncbi:MAG: RNA methyltransferase [Lachnospiraceae bacterium]|nr:RNA methyltransferase [Lachnospiraceae bacterium]